MSEVKQKTVPTEDTEHALSACAKSTHLFQVSGGGERGTQGQGCADGHLEFGATVPYPHVFYILLGPSF